MFRLTLVFAVVFTFYVGSVQADIARSQLTSGVENREPIDDLTNDVVGRPGEITTVYFFTHITKMDGAILTHKWLLNGVEEATVNLRIGSNNWRTYSSKRMNDSKQGDWQVQVWEGDKQLSSHDFTFQIFQ